jgi:hypothetical protein
MPELVYVSPDGAVCTVEMMFDLDGDETDDPDLAVAIVARHPHGGGYIAARVDPEMWIDEVRAN